MPPSLMMAGKRRAAKALAEKLFLVGGQLVMFVRSGDAEDFGLRAEVERLNEAAAALHEKLESIGRKH